MMRRKPGEMQPDGYEIGRQLLQIEACGMSDG